MKKYDCGRLVVLLVGLFCLVSQGAKVVDLQYDDDGSGGLDLSNTGTGQSLAVNFGATLGNQAGQTGTGCALLAGGADYTATGTGKSDMVQGAVQVRTYLFASNTSGCRILEGLGSGDAGRFWITANKDSSGWYLDVRSATWDGGWAFRQLTNWGGTRIDITDGWHTLTYTWGLEGKELYIDKELVASSDDSSFIGQFYVLNTGSKLVTSALGYYDDVKMYDTQEIPKKGTLLIVQ